MRHFFRWCGRLLLLVMTLGLAAALFWADGQNKQIDEWEIFAATKNAPGRIVAVNGRNMHVLIKGKLEADPTGAPIVLLHGFSAAGHATWLPWANQLAAARRTVVLIDMLNFGHSERITEAHDDLTHQGQAALINGLLDALGIGQIDLVGWSMGGAIATQFTLDYSERVRAITFVAGHVYGANRVNPFELLGKLPLGIGRALTWNSLGGSPNGLVARMCATDKEVCHWLDLLLIENTVDGLRAISDTQQISRLPDDVALIDKPVLVIAGEVDEIVPRADSEWLAETLNAKLYIAEGAGHWPAEKDPATVARHILNFFAGNAPEQPAKDAGIDRDHSITGKY
ncbi:MAG: hypothetical protein CL799_00400 [Chromatiales bacterium]|jgi:pimeloyl-ACP methyl ester carboxylesterase|nr:hypothetical protein [Chromatiales bacterium]MDP6150768.1 alpha/beta hydrolase [Gammaproteobacteria bacterium]MDP7270613.1 alpha/beta hydrolase [Gammaproteobacteria bacterium]HJP03921.1 alpha/beta hydrolase [Gammaproteobacteria bacterium]